MMASAGDAKPSADARLVQPRGPGHFPGHSPGHSMMGGIRTQGVIRHFQRSHLHPTPLESHSQQDLRRSPR